MTALFVWLKSPRIAVWLAVGIGVFVVFLAWFGYRASREWQRSSILLVERRTEEAANFLVTGLLRDMRTVQATILPSTTWEGFTSDSPYDVMTLVLSAFARYPYPDSFFTWQAGTPPDQATFFVRSERPPAWIALVRGSDLYPVRIAGNERVASEILVHVRAAADEGRQLAVTELNIDGVPYQIVIQLRYKDRTRQELVAACGFTVNLAWARETYFPQITQKISRLAQKEPSLSLGILDDRGSPVVSIGPFSTGQRVSKRTFPLAFFDPAAVMVNPPPELTRRTWTVVVNGAGDPALAAAIRGGNRTVGLATFAAAVLTLGLVLTTRAMRANAELATMRSEFVSSITHELKTPLASIRALGDSLTSGRVPTPEMQREYAGLVVQEAKRLSHLVDNLLAHARITDIADVYSFELLDVDAFVRNAIAMFSRQLAQDDCRVQIHLPSDLPQVRADPSAMELVMANIIDNAIRYGGARKTIEITGAVRDGWVAIRVKDSGIGIEPEDLNRVTHKFVRGHNAPGGGSGLGLSIVSRVVKDHGGRLVIDSALNEGTTITVELRHVAGDR